jgi:hypothetical protein
MASNNHWLATTAGEAPAADSLAAGRAALTPGCHWIAYVDHTVCHRLDVFWLPLAGVRLVTGYVGHTGWQMVF